MPPVRPAKISSLTDLRETEKNVLNSLKNKDKLTDYEIARFQEYFYSRNIGILNNPSGGISITSKNINHYHYDDIFEEWVCSTETLRYKDKHVDNELYLLNNVALNYDGNNDKYRLVDPGTYILYFNMEDFVKIKYPKDGDVVLSKNGTRYVYIKNHNGKIGAWCDSLNIEEETFDEVLRVTKVNDRYMNRRELQKKINDAAENDYKALSQEIEKDILFQVKRNREWISRTQHGLSIRTTRPSRKQRLRYRDKIDFTQILMDTELERASEARIKLNKSLEKEKKELFNSISDRTGVDISSKKGTKEKSPKKRTPKPKIVDGASYEDGAAATKPISFAYFDNGRALAYADTPVEVVPFAERTKNFFLNIKTTAAIIKKVSPITSTLFTGSLGIIGADLFLGAISFGGSTISTMLSLVASGASVILITLIILYYTGKVIQNFWNKGTDQNDKKYLDIFSASLLSFSIYGLFSAFIGISYELGFYIIPLLF